MDYDSMMENDVLEALDDLGYKGPLLEDGALSQASLSGATSPEYTKVCAWLVSELKLYCNIEESVQATNSPSEAEGFQLEVSGLLSEMNCPYVCLTSGDVTKRLLIKRNCLLLLTYLISELEAARMLRVNIPPKKSQESAGSEVFQELKGICMSLGMSKPPANITMFQFFSGIEKKIKETLSKVPPNHLGKPLLSKQLGPRHWEKIEAINQAISNEYEVRRKMLLKRLDVTVQSFGWSDKAKNQSEKLAKVYQPKRSALLNKCSISVAHLLAARHDLSKILRTSSGSIREKSACAINKVLMGRVPDRGGRPNEIEAPPPEMPPWQKRPEGPQQQGGGRGGGGGRGSYDQSYGGRGSYDHGATKLGAIMVEVEEAIKEEVIKERAIKEAVIKEVAMVDISPPLTLEVDTKVGDTSKTTDIKTAVTKMTEEVAVEETVVTAVVEGAVVHVEAKEVAGEEEAKTIIKVVSLSNIFSMEAINIINLALDKEEIILAEATITIVSRAQLIETQGSAIAQKCFRICTEMHYFPGVPWRPYIIAANNKAWQSILSCLLRNTFLETKRETIISLMYISTAKL
ncbi:hypothetical protein NDU88_005716 [Pleurodeles waltl]|uniref:Protein FAM98A n=1 Tax=Pleurodeles waltl TaxID=8319 RepID=A0AAV7RPU7_PLEWA|nr:hypothetical protein NDU88_005716 [Pleurodeles waltl]